MIREGEAQSEERTCPRLYGATWYPRQPLSHCAILPFLQANLQLINQSSTYCLSQKFPNLVLKGSILAGIGQSQYTR